MRLRYLYSSYRPTYFVLHTSSTKKTFIVSGFFFQNHLVPPNFWPGMSMSFVCISRLYSSLFYTLSFWFSYEHLSFQSCLHSVRLFISSICSVPDLYGFIIVGHIDDEIDEIFYYVLQNCACKNDVLHRSILFSFLYGNSLVILI